MIIKTPQYVHKISTEHTDSVTDAQEDNIYEELTSDTVALCR